MENNFIQMAGSAGHAVAYTISPIFKYIIDCVLLSFSGFNDFTNIVLESVYCLWLVGVTLIFDGIPQIIVQRCQIAASMWPNDISSAADKSILKNTAQNIECSFGCVARSAVLLSKRPAHYLLDNRDDKFNTCLLFNGVKYTHWRYFELIYIVNILCSDYVKLYTLFKYKVTNILKVSL